MTDINETIWQIDLPTKSGKYEYRWTHGSEQMKKEWVPVEVRLDNGVLLVHNPKQPKARRVLPLWHFTDAQWRKVGGK